MRTSERVAKKLGLTAAELESLYTRQPVEGFRGDVVADDIMRRFGLQDVIDSGESFGEQLYHAEILTLKEARWLDDE